MAINGASGSSSSADGLVDAKNFVGGSWRLSPATITLLPRRIAGTASAGSIWLASSKMTRSKNWRSAGSSWLTTRGLIIQQGLSANKTSGAAPKSWRTGR